MQKKNITKKQSNNQLWIEGQFFFTASAVVYSNSSYEWRGSSLPVVSSQLISASVSGV